LLDHLQKLIADERWLLTLLFFDFDVEIARLFEAVDPLCLIFPQDPLRLICAVLLSLLKELWVGDIIYFLDVVDMLLEP
jgi:hypothetical protein